MIWNKPVFDTEPFLNRVYDKRRYNCIHFCAEIWKARTGEDYYARLRDLIECAVGERKAISPRQFGFRRLLKPIDPCLVFMHNLGNDLHAGICLTGDYLFHIQPQGVEYVPLPVGTRGFKHIRYYQ